MTRTFFNEARAREFAESLEAQGFTTSIWTDMDGFKQKIYIVKWY